MVTRSTLLTLIMSSDGRYAKTTRGGVAQRPRRRPRNATGHGAYDKIMYASWTADGARDQIGHARQPSAMGGS